MKAPSGSSSAYLESSFKAEPDSGKTLQKLELNFLGSVPPLGRMNRVHKN